MDQALRFDRDLEHAFRATAKEVIRLLDLIQERYASAKV